jgi:hypothetical protein
MKAVPVFSYFFLSFFVISLRILTSFENSASVFLLFGYLLRRSRLSFLFVIVRLLSFLVQIYFVQMIRFYPVLTGERADRLNFYFIIGYFIEKSGAFIFIKVAPDFLFNS